jgi:nicotinate-nucleotide adenylyltransferase
MGGTFDPIHCGHLHIAEEARRVFGLSRVEFVTAADPPHKPEGASTSAEHRHAMVLLAIEGRPHFRASRRELDRSGPSYSITTIQEYQAEEPDAEIYFITGADAILEILTWHRADELVRLCTFVAVTRPGYDLSALERVLPKAYLPHIQPLAATGVAVSSTEIRARLRRGESIREMTPVAVERYIEANGLYVDGVGLDSAPLTPQ